jgi:hypothetical protein
LLNKAITDKISDFVRQKPRTVQEIAFLIEKNWKTADRYLALIETETGLISTRTFRKGTRGALKVVFWNSLDKAKGSAFQQMLLQKILNNKRKEDFSPFDIYQFVSEEKRRAFISEKEYSVHKDLKYDRLLSEANHQILFFSGNMSWVELGPNSVILRQIEQLAKKKVSLKILTRVDLTSRKNIEKLLAINKRAGWDAIEIRHAEQPVRAAIIDDRFMSIKEVLSPEFYKQGELAKKTFLFYKIDEPEWLHWMQKVFWHIFRQSVDAEARLKALNSMQRVLK